FLQLWHVFLQLRHAFLQLWHVFLQLWHVFLQLRHAFLQLWHVFLQLRPIFLQLRTAFLHLTNLHNKIVAIIDTSSYALYAFFMTIFSSSNRTWTSLVVSSSKIKSVNLSSISFWITRRNGLAPKRESYPNFTK